MLKDFRTEKEKHKYYNALSDEQKTDVFSEIVAESEYVVFLGGSGVP